MKWVGFGRKVENFRQDNRRGLERQGKKKKNIKNRILEIKCYNSVYFGLK